MQEKIDKKRKKYLSSCAGISDMKKGSRNHYNKKRYKTFEIPLAKILILTPQKLCDRAVNTTN